MRYTLGQAAKATGKAKTTIQRAIKKGQISAQKSDSGAYSIDPAELHRVFPTVSGDTPAEQSQRNDAQHPAEHLENAVLKAENEQLRQQVEDLREQREDLREQRDSWRQQATALLPAPEPKRSWWPWRR